MTHAVLTSLGLTGQESGTYLGHGEWSQTRDAGVIEPVNPGNGEVLGKVYASSRWVRWSRWKWASPSPRVTAKSRK